MDLDGCDPSGALKILSYISVDGGLFGLLLGLPSSVICDVACCLYSGMDWYLDKFEDL